MQVSATYTPLPPPLDGDTVVDSRRSPSPSYSDDPLFFQPQPQLSVSRERKRMGWHLLLGTFVMVMISAGLSTLLVLWVVWIHGVPAIPGKSIIAGVIQTGAFLVNEGTKKNEDGIESARLVMLTISSVTTGAVAASAPILVMMAAYCIAGAWLAQQNRPVEDGRNLPTPTQYGLLIKLSSTAGLAAIYDTARYLFVRGVQRRREHVPPLLPVAFVAVVAIYLITHLIAASDLYLHLTSCAMLHNTTFPVGLSSSTSITSVTLADMDNQYPFGVAFNDTLCSQSPGSSTVTVPCLYEGPGWAGYVPTVAKSGLMIASNSTPVGLFDDDQPSPRHPLSVISLHDEGDLAVIVPSMSAAMNRSLTWTAPTYGMRVGCRNLTPDCLTDDRSTNGDLVYNCSKAGYPSLPSGGSSTSQSTSSSPQTQTSSLRSDSLIPGHVLMNANTATPITNIFEYLAKGGAYLPNPHEVQIELDWPNTLDDSGGDEVLNTVVDFRDLGGKATAFVACQVEYFNLTVRYDGPSSTSSAFSVVEGSMESTTKEFMAVMAGPLWMEMINLQLHANVQARAISDKNDDNIIAALNQEISRLSLATFAGSVVTQAPDTLAITKSTFVSRYPLKAVVIYTGLLYLYATVVLAIFSWASTIKTNLVRVAIPDTEMGTRDVTALELAQGVLTDPLVLVGLGVPRSLNGLHSVQHGEGRRGSSIGNRLDMFGEFNEAKVASDDVERKERERTGQVGLRAPRLELGIVSEGENAGLVFGVNEWRPKKEESFSENA